jgi:hypothetical protein
MAQKEINKKDQDWRSVETLGSLGHGDSSNIAKSRAAEKQYKKHAKSSNNKKSGSSGRSKP